MQQSQPENIDNILEDIQKNVSEEKTPEYNKVTERLIIEDNPLRASALKILDSVTVCTIQTDKILRICPTHDDDDCGFDQRSYTKNFHPNSKND